MNIYYVYQLRLATSEDPFYIGKGHDYRYNDHFYEAKGNSQGNHKLNTMRKAMREGVEIKVEFIIEGLSEEDAGRYEVWAIHLHGRSDKNEGYLTNAADGGEGRSGSKHTEDWKVKKSNSMKGHKNHFAGKTHNEETRMKISEKRKEIYKNNPDYYKISNESRLARNQKLSGSGNGMYGKPALKHTKEAISKAVSGTRFYANPESLELIRADHQPKGFYPWSPRSDNGFGISEFEAASKALKFYRSNLRPKDRKIRTLRS